MRQSFAKKKNADRFIGVAGGGGGKGPAFQPELTFNSVVFKFDPHFVTWGLGPPIQNLSPTKFRGPTNHKS